jgi:acyl carrier protein
LIIGTMTTRSAGCDCQRGFILSTTLKELQNLIQEKYGLDASQVDPLASLRASGVDSLALVEFIFDVEDRMGINVPDDNPNIDTLAALAEAIDRVRGKSAQPMQAPA